MRKTFPLLLVLLVSPASGREGFSVSLGLGGGFWSVDWGSLDKSLAAIGRNDGYLLKNTLEDGLGLRFAMAYNIREYASVEFGITGHGWNLGGDDLGGSGFISLVAHLHPLQFWIPERKYDATIYLGGGYSIIGGGYENDDLSRGLDGGTVETGFTGRYFVTPWLSLGADFRFIIPVYKRWIVDWNDDEDYSLESSPDMLFFGLLFVTTFHFQASN